MHTAYFERFALDLALEDARLGAHQGQCDNDIAALREVTYIKAQLNALDSRKLRDELRGYGAWDDDELADHEVNKARILWIACGNILEDEAR